MPRSQDTSRPTGEHWGIYESTAELPNVAGASVQTHQLDRGDLAVVAAASSVEVYACTSPAYGAATWAEVPYAGGTIDSLSLGGTLAVTGATTLTGGLVGTGLTRVATRPGNITATTGTDVAPSAAGDEYLAELVIQYNRTLTGAAILNGPTVGTDKWIFALWDSSGALVANTALAGTTTSGADTWQQIAFASTYAALPGRYFLGVQSNGTTDNFHAIAGLNLASTQLATTDQGSFGTVSDLAAVPSTFTVNVGPIMYVY